MKVNYHITTKYMNSIRTKELFDFMIKLYFKQEMLRNK